MRQAGRYLPEYRAVREKHDFLTMCKTPALAAEVTVQPIDIIGTDAAILFSDILVIPEAMGMHLEMIESKGPVFPDPIRQISDIDKLEYEGVVERLKYVTDAVVETKQRLADRVPLIGFSGSPWTLATYMIEGGASKNHEKVKAFIYENPDAAHRLLSKLADIVADYLIAKIGAGCDAVQIFDTWASLLSPGDFEEFSLRYIRQICRRLQGSGVPVIVFAKGIGSFEPMREVECDVLGVDWVRNLGDVSQVVGNEKALQGNLDPTVLFGPRQKITESVERILKSYGTKPGHIFNLGHGILPKTPVENVRHLVASVRSISEAMLLEAGE
jgi:uroporphyrinogen decarboxylase